MSLIDMNQSSSIRILIKWLCLKGKKDSSLAKEFRGKAKEMNHCSTIKKNAEIDIGVQP